MKELSLYDELNLTEITGKLNYSSVAHLSGQFRANTDILQAAKTQEILSGVLDKYVNRFSDKTYS